MNQSGEIDRKDFEMAVEVTNQTYEIKLFRNFETFVFFFFHLAQKICELRGWPVGNSRNTETHESMFKIWEGLRAKADKDNDGQVGQSCFID